MGRKHGFGNNRTDDERFWDLVITEPNCGCFIWGGAIVNDFYKKGNGGYGIFTIRVEGKSKNVLAHRWAYERFIGPLGAGLVPDHKCRVRSCVNPAHLEAVTQKVNVRRGVGPCAVNAAKTHCKRGHEFTPENTWYEKNGARHCRTCQYERQSLKMEAAAKSRGTSFKRRGAYGRRK